MGAGQTSTPSSSSTGFGAAGTTAGGVIGPGSAAGGVLGVVSKSKEASLRVYNGRNHYNEWVFVATAQSNRAGGPGGTNQPGINGRGANQPGLPPQGGTSNRGGLPGPGGAGGFGGTPNAPGGGRGRF